MLSNALLNSEDTERGAQKGKFKYREKGRIWRLLKTGGEEGGRIKERNREGERREGGKKNQESLNNHTQKRKLFLVGPPKH